MLNTGIDPSSHWTSEQWDTAGKSLHASEERSLYIIRNLCATGVCRSKEKGIMGFESTSK